MSTGTVQTESTETILTSPPFVIVEGIVNIRSVGGYSCIIDSVSQVELVLRALRVKKIFDFRSDSEIQAYKAASLEIEGVEVVRIPVSQDEAYDPGTRVQYRCNAGLDVFPFANLDLFIQFTPQAFAKFLFLLLTAGKDRTGLFAALFLKLLGVSDEDIAKDYSLTEIGLEPMMPILIARFRNAPVFKDNWEATLKMTSAKPETILATLDSIQKKYGSVEGYLKEKAGLTDEDFGQIRKNTLIPNSTLKN
ncbi:hypothetical protein EW146_g7615 [Bondarzewia mesenterica]|uniref:Tyrosine specific protein phosphatases domain-containing protein n=1 Tax=Bondarzewia mesenterica TaxID=1095465 RepID=A0A4S4LM54_9AGAM|nr:hypothetical protein EW146_g7615 [Bondarzewia mesenterica]